MTSMWPTRVLQGMLGSRRNRNAQRVIGHEVQGLPAGVAAAAVSVPGPGALKPSQMMHEAPECFDRLTALMTGKARRDGQAVAAGGITTDDLEGIWLWVGEEATRLGGGVTILLRDLYKTGITPSAVIKVCDHLLCAPQGVQIQVPLTAVDLGVVRKLAETHSDSFEIAG